MPRTASLPKSADSAPGTFDPHAPPPSGAPCPNCGCPVEASDKFCPACGTPNAVTTSHPAEQSSSTRKAPVGEDEDIVAADVVAAKSQGENSAALTENQRHFRCEQCGAEVMVDPQQRSYICAFCDSNYVAEFTRDTANRQSPEFIIGFAVTPEQARDKFRAWIRSNAWFNPGDLPITAVEDKQRGMYLPFWSFPMFAASEWNASIGEYWQRTETYTEMENGKLVTKTRTVTETEWWPLQGRHHHFYNGYLVSGSKGLTQAEAHTIMPYNLPALKRYEPYFLAGWICEEYSIDRDTALQMSQHEYNERERRNISAFLPGDTSSQLNVETKFRHVSSDLCLLPLYVLSYRYQNKLYRFLVNGQTGKCDGQKPLSWSRIAIAIGIGLFVFVVALLIIMAIAAH